MSNILISDFGTHDILMIWHNNVIIKNYLKLQEIFMKDKNAYDDSVTAIITGHRTCGATIKGGLYGAELNIILPKLYEYGCRYFFTASLPESIQARDIFCNHNIDNAKIIMLNGVMHHQEKMLIKYDIMPSINSLNQLILFNNFAKNLNVQANCVLHIDTGMTRHGISYNDAQKIQNSVSNPSNSENIISNLNINMYISHFYAIKDDYIAAQNNQNYWNTSHTQKQIDNFIKIKNILPDKPFSFSATDASLLLYSVKHKNNLISNNLSTYKESIIKPGAGLVGAVHFEENIMDLDMAFEIYARVSEIIDINPGQNISYSINQASEKMRIAIINIGYGDGYMKTFTGTKVQILNYQVKVLCVNLNCSIIDISSVPLNEIMINGSYKNDLYVELCGKNIDIRYTAIKDGCYQVFDALGKGSINVKKIFMNE